MKPGPTHDYPPEGPLDSTDKGGLMAAASIEGNKIRIEFGTTVKWLALSKSDAMGLVLVLIKLIDELPDEEAKQ